MIEHSYRFETRDARATISTSRSSTSRRTATGSWSKHEDPSELRNVAYSVAREVRGRSGVGLRTVGRGLSQRRTIGLYLVTENVKRGEDRIDIDSPDDTARRATSRAATS